MELNTGKELQNGKYRILGILGQGGFGITYLAEQTALGRKVAIKEFFMKDLCNRDDDGSHVSVPSVGSKELVERFRQKFLKEARSIASLEHKHIVPVIDVFEENGTAYYVMKYFGGGSLSSCTALSEEKALRYIRQIASAIDFIHSRHMMHLDIKPGNILLDSEDNAIVIDFGLAKQYDEAGHQTSTTPVGISHGYAPLEQYKAGGVSSFSPATDIYSLGATLYRLLTGNRPADAMDLVSAPFPACPANVSASIWNAVKSAMQPAIASRPQSVEEFIELVESGKCKDESGEMKDATSIFGNASSEGSSAASQNVMPLGSQKASVAKDERAKSKDETSLSMETGKNASNGNAAVDEQEDIAVEVVETPSVAPEPAPRPQPEENQKKNKWLWIIIPLAIICGALGGFMFIGSGGDVKRDSVKDTSVQQPPKVQQQQEQQSAKEPDSAKIKTETAERTLHEKLENESGKLVFTASVPKTVVVGKYFRLTYTINAHVDDGEPMLPEMPGFEVVSGPARSVFRTEALVETKFEYVVKPVKTGNFHISGAKINVGGKQLYSNGVNIKVQENNDKVQDKVRDNNVINGYSYVDLGLPSGLKWATCNVGASKPEGYGNHYAWGETESKSNYSWSTYKWCNGSYGTITKYCSNSSYGRVDNKRKLELSDDVARKQWGSTWRLPTKAEFEELLNENNCTWTWTTQNGIKGYKVTSKKNGNSIFLPAAGLRYGTSLHHQGTRGHYWSSTPHRSNSFDAYCPCFNSGSHFMYWYSRSYGQSVRPVTK